jgi:hypothetical protein
LGIDLRLAQFKQETPMSAQRKYENDEAFSPDYEGMPLAALGEHERFLVMAIRVWAKGVRARVCPLRLLAPRFVMAGRLGLLVPTHTFMLALANGAARAIGVACNEAIDVTPDEALILTTLDHIRNRDPAGARAWLAGVVRARDISAVTHSSVELCVAMGR